MVTEVLMCAPPPQRKLSKKQNKNISLEWRLVFKYVETVWEIEKKNTFVYISV